MKHNWQFSQVIFMHTCISLYLEVENTVFHIDYVHFYVIKHNKKGESEKTILGINDIHVLDIFK